MGFHAFSLDPRTILGIGPDASLEEIHEAYRAKSKKHHPDRGGDEWAFRMVARAYEVLKTTAAVPAAGPTAPWAGRASSPPPPEAARSADWSWGWANRSAQPGPGPGAGAAWRPADEPSAEASSADAEEERLDPSRIRTVDVELIWTRFEKDRPARLLARNDADDATLSVCMVISWPEAELVDHTAEFLDGAETLRSLIELFERLRGDRSVVATRSRIEDGRFVGWLSYPDVLTAQDAVLTLRETFGARGLTIKLQTRDERVPFDWTSGEHAPVMSQAS